MAGNLLELTDATFEEEVLKADTPVLVDFWAPWCGPCKMIMPFVEELADEYAGRVKIGKVNADDCGTTAASYAVTGLPTLMLFRNGEVVDKLVGAPGKAHLSAMLDKHLEATAPAGDGSAD